MDIEKEKLKVNLLLSDGTALTGFVHIDSGERLQDFINDPRKSFIAVTEANLFSCQKVHHAVELAMSSGLILLNKASIHWILEA